MGEIKSFCMETYARRSFNYYDNMVDEHGEPYFNVFWTPDVAMGAHDWPDFGDVRTRQLQGVVMARLMTGMTSKYEQLWLSQVVENMNANGGLLYRPKTNYSKHEVDIGDQALTLYALTTVYAENRDEKLLATIINMIDALDMFFSSSTGDDVFPHSLEGFIIKSFMATVRVTGYEPALKLASKVVNHVFNVVRRFSPDNNFNHGGHMHGNLRMLLGTADYALYTGDPILYSRVDAIFRYLKDEVITRFGFLPEQINRDDDIVICETCAIMDYLALACTLANNGHPEYWSHIERIARNHLVESQMRNGDWLPDNRSLVDNEQFTYRDIGKRMVGAFAGWSSPMQFLGVHESLFWGGDELRGKLRAFQNCCGGSGTHAFYIVWKNATHFKNGTLYINLHIDKLTPEAEVRCLQPYKGETTIKIRKYCNVRVRTPDFCNVNDIVILKNGMRIPSSVWGNFLEFDAMKADDIITLLYPMPTFVTQETTGNRDHKQWKYNVTWKGDTVVLIEPACDIPKTAYSEREQCYIPVFYGNEGNQRLYERNYMLLDIIPEPEELYEDVSPIDFWTLG